jgi:hypothetical protein
VISEYERYNHLRPKVMQFTDEEDLEDNNDDAQEVSDNTDDETEEEAEGGEED